MSRIWLLAKKSFWTLLGPGIGCAFWIILCGLVWIFGSEPPEDIVKLHVILPPIFYFGMFTLAMLWYAITEPLKNNC